MANTDGGVFGYAGLYADFRLGDHILILPSAGAGGYSEGDSKDLGGVFEFHLGATLAYIFEDDSSLGVISNARINESNPGVNSLLLSYSLPLERLF